MVKYTGKDMFIKFGTLNISGQGRAFEVNEEANEIDATTYGSEDNEYILGMIDRDSSLEILDDRDNSAIRNALAIGTSGSLTWFPVGTASGNPKFAVGTALVRRRTISYPHDDVVLLSCDVRISGPVVEGSADGSGL